MRHSALRKTLALALLAALGSVAAGDDVWLTDFEPAFTSEPTIVGDDPGPLSTPAITDAAKTERPAATSGDVISTDSEPLPSGVVTTDASRDVGADCYGSNCECGPKRRFYADAEIMALRPHFGETAVGKVAERYEMSERFVFGVENNWGAGGRIRYWSYDRTTPLLPGAGDSIRFDFDVVDFEGTTRLSSDRFDLVIAGGLRWADIKIDIDSGRSRNDMPGGTIAADLRALICRDCNHGLEWHSITGARMSIFGGDWEGGANGLIAPTRDDNITVVEIHGGVECACDCRGHAVLARLLFESQNWRSDALGRDAGQDSLSFIGPGASLGMIY